MPDCMVMDIRSTLVIIKCSDPTRAPGLKRLGGRRQWFGSTWSILCQDEAALATTLGQLRDLGIPFQGEPAGWPPAAVFQAYRDRGLVTGKVLEASNRGPKWGWRIVER